MRREKKILKILVLARLINGYQKIRQVSTHFKAHVLNISAQVGDFDCCNLSLQICKDPVVTPEGVLYEREAILTYMVDQKAKIAATKKRKLKEAEKEDEDETPKKKVFKGQCEL